MKCELWLLVCLGESGCPDRPVCPTLALMIVGLGSKMPCIFLSAGMTKRLQVTTADTGFPRTDGRTERREQGEKNIWVTSLQNHWVNHSFSQLHTLPGRAKINLRAPSMSKVANVVGRLKKQQQKPKFYFSYYIKYCNNSSVSHRVTYKVFLPWFHENTTKVNLSMKINIQHLLKVVLKKTTQTKLDLRYTC